MELRKTIYSAMPSLVEYEGAVARINFDVEEKTVTSEAMNADTDSKAEERTVWEGYAVRVMQPVTRDKVIDAIVTAAYPSDVMQAVINNHLLDESDDEHLAEWTEMQAWRKHAKEVADEVVEL